MFLRIKVQVLRSKHIMYIQDHQLTIVVKKKGVYVVKMCFCSKHVFTVETHSHRRNTLFPYY